MRLSPPESRFTKTEKGHGRIEKRTIIVNSTRHIDTSIPYIAQTFCVIRETFEVSKAKYSKDVAYGITSLEKENASPEKLFYLVRGHWAIENSSHYVRDVTMGEDASRIRKGAGPRIMATLRNLIISLLHILDISNIARAMSHFSWSKKAEAFKILGLGKA
jgi:hypothetical protein